MTWSEWLSNFKAFLSFFNGFGILLQPVVTSALKKKISCFLFCTFGDSKWIRTKCTPLFILTFNANLLSKKIVLNRSKWNWCIWILKKAISKRFTNLDKAVENYGCKWRREFTKTRFYRPWTSQEQEFSKIKVSGNREGCRYLEGSCLISTDNSFSHSVNLMTLQKWSVV